MNELQIFNNEKFGRLEIVLIEGKIYFKATEVAEMLGYKNPHDAILRHCRNLVKHEGIENSGFGARKVKINLINEGDVLRLIVGSELEGADKIERWIFDEVIPQIMKTGSYNVPTNLSSLDTLKLLVNSLEQQDNRLNIMEGKIETVKEIITEDEFDWREDTKKKIKHIAYVTGGEYKKTYDNIYLKLESDGRCNLKIRQDNMKRRYEKAGKRLAEINKVSKLDVIGEDPVLKNLFVKIVNVEYARVNL